MTGTEAAFLLGFAAGAAAAMAGCAIAALVLLRARRDGGPDDEPTELAGHRLPYDVGTPLPVSERGAGSFYPRPPHGSPARERAHHDGQALLRLVGPAHTPPSRHGPHHDGDRVCNSSLVRGDSIQRIRATATDSRRPPDALRAPGAVP